MRRREGGREGRRDYLPVGQIIDPLFRHMMREPFKFSKERGLVFTEKGVVVPQWFLPEAANVDAHYFRSLEDLGREGGTG